MASERDDRQGRVKRKQLTIKDRVELLLEHGVDHPEKWATVHGYEEPLERHLLDREALDREWQLLREHHLEETNFLFDMLRAMVEKIYLLDEQMASIVVDPSMEDDD